MANFIYGWGRAVDVALTTSDKIAISCYTGKVNIYTAPEPSPGMPKSYAFLQSLEGAAVVLGTYSVTTYFRIEMTEAGVASYVVGARPALSVYNIGGTSAGMPTSDISGTPGAATQGNPRGRAAIALGASSVVITNALCLATSTVIVQAQSADATATRFTVVPGAGSFTVTTNANATAAVTFDYVIIN